MHLGIFLTYISLVFLALHLDKHYKVVFNKKAKDSLKALLKYLGFTFLIFSLSYFIYIFGISLGITYFTGFLTPLIFLISMILTYKAKILYSFSLLAFIITILISIITN